MLARERSTAAMTAGSFRKFTIYGFRQDEPVVLPGSTAPPNIHLHIRSPGRLWESLAWVQSLPIYPD